MVGCGATVHDGQDSNGVFFGAGSGLSHHGNHDGDGEGVGADFVSAIGQRAHELEGGEGTLGGGAVEFEGGLDDGGDGAGLDGDTAVDIGEAEREEDLGGGFGEREVARESVHEVWRARGLVLRWVGNKRTF